MIIEQPARFLRWLYPHALWRLNRQEKVVYLTFDDGPIPEATPWILDTLRKYHIKATFFMVGDNVRKYPEVFEMVKRDGHRLGNHTYHHIGSVRHLSKTYIADIQKANEMLQTDLFRPPHGWMLWKSYRRLKHRYGYRVVMWDLVTRDYSCRLTAQDVLENVKRYTRPGSIITFHDSLKSIDKLKLILPEALEWILAQGYEFRVIE